MKIVCKYCKCEITAEVRMVLAGKITRELICMNCLINYIEKHQHLGINKFFRIEAEGNHGTQKDE